ncbi:hypothetical protein NEPAR06_2292 [Nematocida parisii]|nr:uncharacterized protein NEPG_02366 [Nematocida parisii ERTm1]EIJ92675.1 hypothetical protein NEPG_02366 [Nematocida parisii ERTm1]KAI5143000.1 hypothetical protein NEPAR07_0416 [Nematocida parisii]KAI5156116.1 hypothetical protein NEPAR05_0293 [Nematocida parisii]KAI5156809.1 hypothetical protein NEPAR06_2292 [Nematocida parisii]|eukprot:XP_013060193.1 hypothetical protein NEPG_02366 [Nematocida parisii ERTm1]
MKRCVRILLLLCGLICLVGIGMLMVINTELVSKLNKNNLKAWIGLAPAHMSRPASLANTTFTGVGQDNSNTNVSLNIERKFHKVEIPSSSSCNDKPVLILKKPSDTKFSHARRSSSKNATAQKNNKINSCNAPMFTKKQIADAIMIAKKQIADSIKENLAIKSNPTKSPVTSAIKDTVPKPLAKPKSIIEALETISKKNPHLVKSSYSNTDINEIIKHQNKVVVEITRSLDDIEKKTLWEVLQACSKEITIYNDYDDLNTSIDVSIEYPEAIKPCLIVKHALFSYYTPRNTCDGSLSISGFFFNPNEKAFSEYKIFHFFKKLTISNTTAWTSALNLLNDFSNLKELSFGKETILNTNNSLDLSLPNLERLKIQYVNEKYVNLLLDILNFCVCIKEITIEQIDLIDTDRLNSIGNLENITSFTLKNIVFIGFPDFTFLEKMSALKELTMQNIFYSYTEKFTIENLSEIKQDPSRLNPECLGEPTLDLKKRNAVHFSDMINRNKAIGTAISPTSIYIDSKLYNDLGIHKMVPKQESEYNIYIGFSKKAASNWIDSVVLGFFINYSHMELYIVTTQFIFIDHQLLNYMECIDFPFLHAETIDEIFFVKSLLEPSKNKLISVFFKQIIKYAEFNKIKNIQISSLSCFATVDIYDIIEITNNMAYLESVEMHNVSFSPTKTIPRNSNEEKALQSYAKYIQSEFSLSSFSFMFVKKENILRITKAVCMDP